MLHVLNGESTAQAPAQSNLAGEHLVWKEALIWGPTPANTNLSEGCRIRADFLAGTNGMDVQQCFEELMQQEAALGPLANHDEVVLWTATAGFMLKGEECYGDSRSMSHGLPGWRVNRNRSWSRFGRPCQNSIVSGATQYPPQ